MSKIKIGVLGPSEIANRRFIPGLLAGGRFVFAGVAYASPEEWGGVHSWDDPVITGEKKKAQAMAERFGGKVPGTMEELLTLPGVGRKTANLILGDIYRVPGSTVVDTHCIRISNRLGLVDGLKEPEKIERALREVLPPEKSSDFCHRIVLHGRAVCDARKPRCEACCCAPWCKTFLGE